MTYHTCSEHAPNVSVPLIEPFLDDGIDEGTSVEQHSLIAGIVVFLGHLAAPMGIPLPKFHIANLLNLSNPGKTHRKRAQSKDCLSAR